MRLSRIVPGAAAVLISMIGAPPAAAEPNTTGGAQLAGKGVTVSLPAGMAEPPKIKAGAWVIAEAETGHVLAARDAHGQYLPASTLKMLTATTLIPRLDPAGKVTPSEHACSVEGSAVGLKETLSYRVDDLFRALMMVSGNDAALALAEANGGLEPTLEAMNAEARRLQAYDTVAKTPNGLDRPGQTSSAYDLALIARAGLTNPDFRRYVTTKVADFPAPKGKTYQIQNHNKLLWQYRGGLGIKNGWTSKAMASFAGAAERDGHTIIVTLMRYEEPPFWDDVKAMLDWGFSARGKVTPVGRLVDPLPAATATPSAPVAASPVVRRRGPGLLGVIGLGSGAAAILGCAVYIARRRLAGQTLARRGQGG